MSPGVLSPWLVLPVAGVLMLLVGAVQIRIQKADAPASRKRIRAANGWIMLLAIPFLAAGFCLINPTMDPRAFLLTWAAGTGLMLIAVLLALLDVANTWRLNASNRRAMVDSFHALRATAHGAASRKPNADAAPQERPDAS